MPSSSKKKINRIKIISKLANFFWPTFFFTQNTLKMDKNNLFEISLLKLDLQQKFVEIKSF